MIAGEARLRRFIPRALPRSRRGRVIDKPGKGAFYAQILATSLPHEGSPQLSARCHDRGLRSKPPWREANDRGLSAFLATDATGELFSNLQAAAIEMIVARGGIVGGQPIRIQF